MNAPMDIRKYVKKDRHRGTEFEVVIWFGGSSANIRDMKIGSEPRISDKDWPTFENVDRAMEFARVEAAKRINAMLESS